MTEFTLSRMNTTMNLNTTQIEHPSDLTRGGKSSELIVQAMPPKPPPVEKDSVKL